jgi:hypothetical protein
VREDRFIGRPLDSLTLRERWQLAGMWIATEMYSPETVPLRVIEAIGSSAQDCIEQLVSRGLPPSHYEFLPLAQPYRP